MNTTVKLAIAILFMMGLNASAYGQSPREHLQQMVDQLQETPNDNALRQRIIKLGIEMKPVPTLGLALSRRNMYRMFKLVKSIELVVFDCIGFLRRLERCAAARKDAARPSRRSLARA